MDILKPGVSYDFRVIAVNDYGYGTPSTPSPSVSGVFLGGFCPPVPQGGSCCCSVLMGIAEPHSWLLQSPKSHCQHPFSKSSPLLWISASQSSPSDPVLCRGVSPSRLAVPCPPLILPAVPQPRKPTRSTRSGGSWWSLPWWGSSSSSSSSSCSSSVGRARSTPRNLTQVSVVGEDRTLLFPWEPLGGLSLPLGSGGSGGSIPSCPPQE